MEPVTSLALESFMRQLGERISTPARLYLLGGSALCLLGNPRETLDVDYIFQPAAPESDIVVNSLAAELHMDVESVPLGEFIPLPTAAEQRKRYVGRYGNLEIFIFDLYSIALSKIARGFESDLEDVQFLLTNNLIQLSQLEVYYEQILPQVSQADIDPREFEDYFNELKRRVR